MKKRFKKFFKDHEFQMYSFVANVAVATGVGVLIGRKIVKDNTPVCAWTHKDKEGNISGVSVTLKNSNEMWFFKEIPLPPK